LQNKKKKKKKAHNDSENRAVRKAKEAHHRKEEHNEVVHQRKLFNFELGARFHEFTQSENHNKIRNGGPYSEINFGKTYAQNARLKGRHKGISRNRRSNKIRKAHQWRLPSGPER
jgi:hypothetical protein